MKVYNLVVSGNNWMSSTLYTKLEDAINEVDKMVEGQKYLEGSGFVCSREIGHYEALPTPFFMNYGDGRKYAVETRSKFGGEVTTMWRVVYEQEVK